MVYGLLLWGISIGHAEEADLLETMSSFPVLIDPERPLASPLLMLVYLLLAALGLRMAVQKSPHLPDKTSETSETSEEVEEQAG